MKNLFKKIGALLVAAVMVLSMCTAVFAEDSATITLNDFSDADSVKYMQIIEPDSMQPTGWKFSNDVAKGAFTAVTGKEEQDTLWMLILKANPKARNNTELKIPAALKEITNAQIDKALSTIKTNGGNLWKTVTDKNSMTVTSAGVYAFDAEKANYTYKVATAYVGFEAYETTETTPALKDASVAAKRSQLTIDKISDDDDNAVAIGDTVNYTITTFVPYIDANTASTGRTFKITDEIDGAAYVTNENGEVAGTVILGEGDNAKPVSGAHIIPSEDGKTFTITLDSLVTDVANPKAGEKVTVKYQAKITALTASNTAKGHKSGQEYDGSSVGLYTGSITLTKVDANNEEKGLAGAEFKVYKVGENNALGEALKFDYNGGVYTYNPTFTRQDAATVVTGTNGEVKVEGLDKGTYHFTETKAPNGYSINEAGKDIALGTNIEKATANFEAASGLKLKDSKLSSLPSTGGMGTYLFTIIGVVVMAGAAGAFFISRRKGSEE